VNSQHMMPYNTPLGTSITWTKSIGRELCLQSVSILIATYTLASICQPGLRHSYTLAIPSLGLGADDKPNTTRHLVSNLVGLKRNCNTDLQLARPNGQAFQPACSERNIKLQGSPVERTRAENKGRLANEYQTSAPRCDPRLVHQGYTNCREHSRITGRATRLHV